MDTIITIELLNEQFKFKADENSTIDPEDIAQYLIEEVRQVEERFPVYARKTNKLAILVTAALNIAKQNAEVKNRHHHFLHDVSVRTDKLQRLIASST